jgi:hypothetical protein
MAKAASCRVTNRMEAASLDHPPWQALAPISSQLQACISTLKPSPALYINFQVQDEFATERKLQLLLWYIPTEEPCFGLKDDGRISIVALNM